MTEMFLQSHEGEISLLPALPDAWATGAIKGIKARGNFEVEMAWEKGKLTQAKIKSLIGGNCRLRTPIQVRVVEVAGGQTNAIPVNSLMQNFEKSPYQKNANAKLQPIKADKGYVISFKTEKGKSYTIVPVQ